jgi:DNA-binding CsgD family transcriptional regulator
MSVASAPSASSVRALRQELRGEQRTQARLRLLEDTGLALARAPRLDEALDTALAAASTFSALEHGAILGAEDGSLRVRAARGSVAPRGTRLPARGAYAAILKPPLRPLLRREVATPLLTGGLRTAGTEWLLPLAALGQPQAVLALMSVAVMPEPEAGDLQSLAAFGASIAAALLPRASEAAPSARGVPREVLERLTARERQVLALLPRGLTNAGIAQALGIAPGTAKIHVERILHKLGFGDRTQAAVQAAVWGIGA